MRTSRRCALDDDNGEIQVALGLSFGKLNRADEEILSYRRALTLKPDQQTPIEKLGLALFKQRRFAESVTTSRTAQGLQARRKNLQLSRRELF